ncbi:hypothetical protein CEXT_397441 [Caerostris extrusa]|uniref:Uncharacterized protein n=1 Tax=Caerostris extrusa TaxID=172846 RepID=A0AAV4Q444_CAEEX|nr:hypothetical protein CEXT_397441 [Caerostris extrusa]
MACDSHLIYWTALFHLQQTMLSLSLRTQPFPPPPRGAKNILFSASVTPSLPSTPYFPFTSFVVQDMSPRLVISSR